MSTKTDTRSKKKKLAKKNADFKKKRNTQKREHARRRAFQRYGVVLTGPEYRAIVASIKDGEPSDTCQFLERKSNIQSLWLVTAKGVEMFAIYNCKRKLIETFLPADSQEVASAPR